MNTDSRPSNSTSWMGGQPQPYRAPRATPNFGAPGGELPCGMLSRADHEALVMAARPAAPARAAFPAQSIRADQEILAAGLQRKIRGPFAYSHDHDPTVLSLRQQADSVPRKSLPAHNASLDVDAVGVDQVVKRAFEIPCDPADPATAPQHGSLAALLEPGKRPRPVRRSLDQSKQEYPRAPRAPPHPESSNRLLRERRRAAAIGDAEAMAAAHPPGPDPNARRNRLVDSLVETLDKRPSEAAPRFTRSALCAYGRASLKEAEEEQRRAHPFVPKRDWDRPAHEPDQMGVVSHFVEREDAYTTPYRADGAVFSQVQRSSGADTLLSVEYTSAKNRKAPADIGPVGDLRRPDPFASADDPHHQKPAYLTEKPLLTTLSRQDHSQALSEAVADPGFAAHHKRVGFSKERFDRAEEKSFMDGVEITEKKEDFMPLYSSFSKDGYFREPLLPQLRYTSTDTRSAGPRLILGETLAKKRAQTQQGVRDATRGLSSSAAMGTLMPSSMTAPFGCYSATYAGPRSCAQALSLTGSLTGTLVPHRKVRDPRGAIVVAGSTVSPLSCPSTSLGTTRLVSGPEEIYL